MISMPAIWNCIGMIGKSPAIAPDMSLRVVAGEPPLEKSNYLYVNLPERPISAELTDRLLERGVAAIIAAEELPSTKKVNWVDLRHPLALEPDSKLTWPVGLIVADTTAVLIQIARFLRSETQAQVIAIVGAEGLRTSQRMMQSVLGQRFITTGPDRLLCDPQAAAQGLLSLDPRTERLLLRLELANPDYTRFIAQSVRPDVVVLTNTRADDSGQITMRAAEDLIQSLNDHRLAIVNADDPGVQDMIGRLPERVFCYGLRPTCDLWASQIESQGREGLRLRIHFNRDSVHVRIPLLGRNSVHTALAAAAVGLESKQSWEEIVAGLRAMSAQLHLIVTPGLRGSTLVEDTYDATPSSTLSVLNLLEEEFPGRKVAVLGDMVEFAPLEIEGHRKVGRRVVDVASILVTVGHMGEMIAREALACGMAKDQVFSLRDNEEAIATLREVLQPNDIALIAGAGQMKMSYIVDRLADTQTSLCEV
jgi:UDP-N-acetylmuramoyl-tripeptide--D-alanyl-D-alanine ligase